MGWEKSLLRSWWFRLVVIVTFLFFCVEKSNELTTRTKYVNNNVSHWIISWGYLSAWQYDILAELAARAQVKLVATYQVKFQLVILIILVAHSWRVLKERWLIFQTILTRLQPPWDTDTRRSCWSCSYQSCSYQFAWTTLAKNFAERKFLIHDIHGCPCSHIHFSIRSSHIWFLHIHSHALLVLLTLIRSEPARISFPWQFTSTHSYS